LTIDSPESAIKANHIGSQTLGTPLPQNSSIQPDMEAVSQAIGFGDAAVFYWRANLAILVSWL
jgi:hypothetical protein